MFKSEFLFGPLNFKFNFRKIKCHKIEKFSSQGKVPCNSGICFIVQTFHNEVHNTWKEMLDYIIRA